MYFGAKKLTPRDLSLCIPEKGAPISGSILMQKAKLMHTSLYPDASKESFKASNGWLNRFKQRHGIRQLKLQGEALSADRTLQKEVE